MIGDPGAARGIRWARPMKRLLPLALVALACALAPSAASASGATVSATARTEIRPGPRAGVQRLHYEFGPVHISPGQNTIEFEGNALKPDVPGWIVGFKPDLVYKDGTVPRVDVIHLHHGVWIANGAPLFAAGEEKTIITSPEGFGWRYDPSDGWIMNHMIHNLRPTPTDVFITYDLDFIPAGSPAAAGIQDVRTVWLDVTGIQPYPVFDAFKGRGGSDGRYTYPDEAPVAARRQLHEEHVDGGPGRRAGRQLRPSAPGRPVDGPQAHARRPQRAAVPLGGEVLRAGRRRVVGRRDDGHARRLARRRAPR